MNKIAFILMIIFSVCTSCEDFLDIKPMGKLVPDEIEEFENLLNGKKTYQSVFMYGNGNCPMMAFSDNVCMAEVGARGYFNSTSVFLDWFGAYALYYPVLKPDQADVMYDQIYHSVAIFNNVIEGIKGIGKDKDPYGMNVIAQARGARAWALLHLGISYGPMYNPSGDNSELSIAYRESEVPLVENPQRSTVEELFKKAEDDLLYAVNYAPDVVNRPVKLSKSTAKALLAELYMYKGDFENMYKYASEAWEELVESRGGVENLIYDYNQWEFNYVSGVTPNPGEDVEVKLTISSPDNLHRAVYNREYLFYRQCAWRSYSFQMTPEYLALFKEGDRRDHLFLLKAQGVKGTYNNVPYDEGIVVADYRSRKAAVNQGMTSPILLLMVAEAAARTNRTSEAMEALRTVRKYRYEPEYAAIEDLSGDALIQEVLNERRREQPISTPERYWDLRRLYFDSGKSWTKQQITRTILGQTVSREINSPEFQLNIANVYIEFNSHWGLTPFTGTWEPYARFEE